MGVLYIGRTKVGEFVTPNKYNLTLTGINGTTIGSGLYNVETPITIEAIPDIGYNFVKWSDGNQDNPRVLKITSELTLEAIFEEKGIIHYTATEDLRTLVPQQLGVISLVQENCTYDENTGQGKLTYNGDITTLQEYSFQELPQLTSIELPNTILQISNYSFQNCTGLTEITIPKSVTTLGTNLCLGCSSITTIIFNAEKCSANDPFGNIRSQISKVIFGDGVQTIPDSLCLNFNNLYEINLPKSLTTIGTSSFSNTSISKLILPDNFISLGTNAFKNVTTLNEIYIPRSFKISNAYSFTGCTNLRKVYYEGTLEDWLNIKFAEQGNPTNNGASLFLQNKKLEGTVIIPDSITHINTDALRGTLYITEIIIPNSVVYIGTFAFLGCKNIQYITLSNSITQLNGYTFYGCDLQELVLPDSIIKLGTAEFYQNTNLKEITISNSVTSIGNSAFFGCSGLTSITIPNSVTSIRNYAFYDCSGLTSGAIGNSVTSIGKDAFCGCSSLTSVNIPNSVTSIGWEAFFNCRGLISVTIPNSVTSISGYAFQLCTNLTSLIYEGTIEQWNSISKGAGVFQGTPLTKVTCSDGEVSLI